MTDEHDLAGKLMFQIEEIAKKIERQYWVRTGRYPDDTPHKTDLGAAVLFLQRQIDDIYNRMGVSIPSED